VGVLKLETCATCSTCRNITKFIEKECISYYFKQETTLVFMKNPRILIVDWYVFFVELGNLGHNRCAGGS